MGERPKSSSAAAALGGAVVGLERVYCKASERTPRRERRGARKKRERQIEHCRRQRARLDV